MGWAGPEEKRPLVTWENPGRREGRDGLASPGHTYAAAAAAAALLAGSCMPSWAQRSVGATALLQMEGQPPGPTRAQRRAPPRPRLPGPSRPIGASAAQPEGRGPQRRASLRQPEHCLTQITVPPYFPASNPAVTACHKGPSNQRSVTGRRRWVVRAAQGLHDSGVTGAGRRPPLPVPPCSALGPWCRASRAFALRTMLLPNILLTGQGVRWGRLAGGQASAWGSGRPEGEQAACRSEAARGPRPGGAVVGLWGPFRGAGRGTSLLVAPDCSVRWGEVNQPAPLPGKLPSFLNLVFVCEMEVDVIFLDCLRLAARSR